MGGSAHVNPLIWPPFFYSNASAKTDCKKIIAVEIVREIARMPSYSTVEQRSRHAAFAGPWRQHGDLSADISKKGIRQYHATHSFFRHTVFFDT